MIARSLYALVLLAPASAQTWSVRFPDLTAVTDLELLPNGEVAMLAFDYVQPQTHHYVASVDLSGTMQRHRRLGDAVHDLAVGTGGALFGAGKSGAGNSQVPWAWSGDFASGDLWSRESLDVPEFEVGAIQYASATGDGGMLAVGTTWDSDYGCCTRPLLVRYAADGSMLWNRRVGVMDSVGNAIVLPDGSLMITRSLNDPTYPSLDLLKLSANGDVLWTKREGVRAGARLAARTDGSVVMTTWAGYVVEMDTDGTVVRSRRIVADNWPADDRPRLLDVVATPDGGFATIGTLIESYTDSDVLVVKFDGLGELEWQRRIGDTGEQEGYALLALPDGGLLAGARDDEGALLVRLDAAGLVAGCDPIPATLPVVDVTWSWLDVGDPSTSELPESFAGGPTSWSVTALPSVAACLGGEVGSRYCDPAVPNSSGAPAVLWAGGSEVVADGDLTLAATSMPADQFGYFLTGQFSGVTLPPGAQGNLCLAGGPIFRFVDEVLPTGPQGAFDRVVDLMNIPGHGAVQVGETWNFQAWFRDMNPTATSNFTDAVGVMYL